MDYFNLSFNQMWYFVKIIENRSLVKTAQNLHVTQSTLSKSILSLEHNLNIQLFIRDKKTMIPTDAGKILYSKWTHIISQIERSLEEARSYTGDIFSSLHIGVLDSHKSESYLPDIINMFHEKYPSTQIGVESAPPITLRTKLEKKELDIIFTVRYDVENASWSNFRTALFQECPLLLSMLPNNPLAKKERITVNDLRPCNLIVISSLHVPTYNIMLTQLCNEYGFEPKIIYSTLNANSQIYNLQNADDAFILDKYHRDYNVPGTISVPIKDTKSGVAIAWNPRNEKKSLRDFLGIISPYCTS